MTGELKIILPGVCGPLAETVTLKDDEVVNDWVRCLSKSDCRASDKNFYDVVSSIFQLQTTVDTAKQVDAGMRNNFPSAALSLIANDMYDPSMFYMHADPVHLEADMDQAVLTPGFDLKIKPDESEALCETLNGHFAEDGLTFFLLDKDQWFVSSKNEIKLDTTSLVDATGRNVNFILPDGIDSSYWKKMLTEAQMLMFSHDVNLLRENTGVLSINSLWFHGAGTMSLPEKSVVNSLCSNHDLLKGLADQLKCDYMSIPNSLDDYLKYLLSSGQDSVNVLHLSDLEHLTNYTDTQPWREHLGKTLENWIYPLLTFANKNRIKVTLYPCNEKQYHFSNRDHLKFWRKSILDEHVNSY